jgi:hypothetical protein
VNATSTTTEQHPSWCATHDFRDDDDRHFCVRTWWSTPDGEADAAVGLAIDNRGRPQIQMWANDNGNVDADEARRLAAALVEAADIMEETA